ncbi:unnamed protein product [Closterium sp. Naga37s-1]|nr:unnamed protein product [Closterium sp. Naga37s-1]
MRLTPHRRYCVTAVVSVRAAAAAAAAGGVGGRGIVMRFGGEVGTEAVPVLVTVRWDFDEGSQYNQACRAMAREGEWVRLEGHFTAPHRIPHKVTAYVEGPPPAFDLLINLFAIVPASDPQPTFSPLPPTLNPPATAAPTAAAAPTPHPVPSHPVPSHPVPSHPVPSHPVPSHPVPSHPVPSHPVPSHPVPSHPVPSHPVPSHPVPSHPVPSHPVPKQSAPEAAATASPCSTPPPLPILPPPPPHHSPRPNLLLNGDFSLRTASWRPMGGCEVLTWHAPCQWGSLIGPLVEPSSLPASHPCTVFERRQMQLHAQWQEHQQQHQQQQQQKLQQQQQQQKKQQEQHPSPEQHHHVASSHPALPILQPTPSVPLAGGPTGAYLEVTGRTATWHGPAQDIPAANHSPESSTARADDSADDGPIRLFVTYAVSAWVRVGRGRQHKERGQGEQKFLSLFARKEERGEEGGAEETEEKEAEGTEGRVVSHQVNIALGVDGGWVNAGSVEASGKEWVRCWGSFRLEKPYRQAVLYVQGPPPGVSILLADVRVVPVEWQERVPWLRGQADRLRKGSLRLRLLSAAGEPIPCAHVSANQTRRAFPLGTCVNSRDLLGNPRYQSFFLPQREGSRTGAQTLCSGRALQLSPEGKGSRSNGAWFSWGVCENELKWTSVEARRGEEDWRDADAMVAWMQDLKGDPPILALCIKGPFSSSLPLLPPSHPPFCKQKLLTTESCRSSPTTPPFSPTWMSTTRCFTGDSSPLPVPSYSPLSYLPYPTPPPYTEAIDSRITSLLTRYPNCFAHMDVNNEMLHGGFFSSRCGPSIVPRMFQFAAQIAPSLVLFLNEYHIEDGEDEKSRPEKYAQFARQLIASGAPVGGLGTQCHISAPVGAHMRHAWSILADVGLPVWVTELDVSSIVEKVRADDLEICLREAFGHGGVEGVVLWGFWEGSGPDRPSMSRKNAHLVRSDWSLTEAGERLERLLEEWTTRGVVGRTDEEGWFVVEGFAGEYEVVVRDGGKEWRTIVECLSPGTTTRHSAQFFSAFTPPSPPPLGAPSFRATSSPPTPPASPTAPPHRPGPTARLRAELRTQLHARVAARVPLSVVGRRLRLPVVHSSPRSPPPSLTIIPVLAGFPTAPINEHLGISWYLHPAPPLPPLPHFPPQSPSSPFPPSSPSSPLSPRSPINSHLRSAFPHNPTLIPSPPLSTLLAGFPISPINPHLGISASGSVPPGAALLLCDDVAAEGSFLLLHLLKSHLLSPPLQGGGAGARQGEGQGEGGCAGGGEGCVRTVCLIALAHPPAHYSHIARRMGVHFTDLCRQHRLAIIDGQSQAYSWQPDGLDPRVCLQQENQKEMPHQDQQQKEMPLQQQQQQQQQAGVYRFSPPVPFSPPPHPPSQTLPSNGYPPHSANASPLRALYSSICAAVSPIGCPHSSQPAHTPSHPSQPPSHPTEPLSRTAPPATTQPAADDAAGSGAGAATSPSPSGAADVAPPARCGGQLCIIIDDVSLLETCAGGDSRLVMDFLSACRGLCTKHHSASLVLLTHSAVHPTTFTFTAPPPPPLATRSSSSSSSPISSPPLLPWLLHLSDVLVLLRPLTSGHASDVHGQADIVHLTPTLLHGPSHGNDSHHPPCQQQHLVHVCNSSRTPCFRPPSPFTLLPLLPAKLTSHPPYPVFLPHSPPLPAYITRGDIHPFRSIPLPSSLLHPSPPPLHPGLTRFLVPPPPQTAPPVTMGRLTGGGRYVKGVTLGKGTFGVVFKAYDTHTGKTVAIKKIHLGDCKEGVNVTALREIKLLQELHHPHIIDLIDIYPHKRNLNLVLEFMETDLENIIKDRSLHLSPADIKAFMRMTLEGLAYCHGKWVLHRDMKPNNLLIGPTGELKIADFGFARLFGSPDRKLTHQVFALWYRAPELLFGSKAYGSGVDVWGAGCVFAELLLRRPFLQGSSDIDQLGKIFAALGTPREDQWPDMQCLPDYVHFNFCPAPPLKSHFPMAGDDALDLLSRMLTFDPNKRITAVQALQHRYFLLGPPATKPKDLPRPPPKPSGSDFPPGSIPVGLAPLAPDAAAALDAANGATAGGDTRRDGTAGGAGAAAGVANTGRRHLPPSVESPHYPRNLSPATKAVRISLQPGIEDFEGGEGRGKAGEIVGEGRDGRGAVEGGGAEGETPSEVTMVTAVTGGGDGGPMSVDTVMFPPGSVLPPRPKLNR